jgi:hypothetical protein
MAEINGSISDLKAKMNKYSVFLSKEENELIFNLIGDQCQVKLTKKYGFISIVNRPESK